MKKDNENISTATWQIGNDVKFLAELYQDVDNATRLIAFGVQQTDNRTTFILDEIEDMDHVIHKIYRRQR